MGHELTLARQLFVFTVTELRSLELTHLRPQVPHRATARQRFLDDGPLGMLPLADGRISVVWSTTDQTARQACHPRGKQGWRSAYLTRGKRA